MTRRWIAIGAAAGAAVLGGSLWVWAAARSDAPSRAAPDGPAVASLEAQLAALHEQFAAERDARLGLAAEVEMLRQLFVEYGAGARFDTATADSAARDTAPAAGDESQAAEGPKSAGRPWFDERALLAQGVSTADAARLEALFEESELELLYLRDQAVREGWAGTPRFMQALYEQRSSLRAKVGDESFDWLLYAAGRNNRVVAQNVLATGPAAAAGLRSGDLILSYDGQTLFRGSELQHLTTQGKAGRPVPVDVVSPGGQVRRLSVPSGPLGIQLKDTRHPPSLGR